MSQTQLPPNIQDLLKSYVGQHRLRELPSCFTKWPATDVHRTKSGVPITYKHRDTGEILKVSSYAWQSARKVQSVVVASGKSLAEPVIIVAARKGSRELKIWKGESNDHDDYECPIYKECGSGITLHSCSQSAMANSLADR
jgi:hypothetical protein